MTSPELTEPITESLEITLHIAQFYPNLLPQQHKATILKLLEELHAIQPLSLSISPSNLNEESGDIPSTSFEKLLLSDDISPQYRKSLEYKREL
jgi:glutathione S-transferase